MSSKKREHIFSDIEASMEANGSYDLNKILESHKPVEQVQTALKDADKEVMQIAIPDILSLFLANRRAKSHKPKVKKVTKQKKEKQTLDQLIDKERQKNIEIKPELQETGYEKIEERKPKKKVIKKSPLIEGLYPDPDDIKDITLHVDLEKAKEYVTSTSQRSKRMWGKFNRFLHILLFLFNVVAGFVSYDINYNNTLSCTTYRQNYQTRNYYGEEYTLIYEWTQCQYEGIDIDFLYLVFIIGWAIYASLIFIVLVARMEINHQKNEREKKVVKMILFAKSKVSKREVESYDKLLSKFIYSGIVTLEGEQ